MSALIRGNAAALFKMAEEGKGALPGGWSSAGAIASIVLLARNVKIYRGHWENLGAGQTQLSKLFITERPQEPRTTKPLECGSSSTQRNV